MRQNAGTQSAIHILPLKNQRIVLVPPGYPCTPGVSVCIGGSFCMGDRCICASGQVIVNEQCVNVGRKIRDPQNPTTDESDNSTEIRAPIPGREGDFQIAIFQ